MSKSVNVGLRVPTEWVEEIDKLCQETGVGRTDIIRDAIAQYLGHSNPKGPVSELKALRDRVEALEKKWQWLAS